MVQMEDGRKMFLILEATVIGLLVCGCYSQGTSAGQSRVLAGPMDSDNFD